MDVGSSARLESESIRIERLAALGEMVAEVAHEINNLMGAILGYAEIARMSTDPTETPHYFNCISDMAKVASDLAGSVLRFSKPPADETGNVSQAISTVLDLYKHRAHKGVRLVFDHPRELPPVALSTGHLQLVLVNLVKNALESIGPHGQGLIHITAEQRGYHVAIGVYNTGKPIPPDVAANLFTPFFSTKAPGRGTGLGLAAARRLARSTGGDLTVSNPENGGVLFTVLLPTVPRDPMRDTQREANPHALHGRRILVVDDDPAVRDVLRLMVLNLGGGQVDTCGSGEEALNALKRSQYDAVVLDLRMPGLSGQEIFQRLPEDLQHRVVFVTGDVLGAKTAGFLASTKQPALYKPLRHADLLEAVGKVIYYS